MPWRILPPEDLIRDPDAIAQAKRLRNALKQPNREEHGLYSKFVRAIVHEIITIGVAAVERQLGDLADTKSQAFWLFLANANNIQLNQSWSPQVAGIEPRFFDYGGGGSHQLGGMPIFSADMFLIQTEANAYELVPPSPLEIAYHMIQSWLGLGEFQTTTTSQAVREYILVLKGANQEDVDAFRAYWESEVEGSGKIPILGGEGVQVEKMGARNDDELYLRYTEYILKIVAVAFDLSNRDYGITEHDNRATAGVSADTVFQDAVLPMGLAIREHLEIEVIDYYFPGFRLEITDTEPRSQEQEATTATALFKERVISRNEARMRAGHEALPGGDIFADGLAVPIEEEAEYDQPPTRSVSLAASARGQKAKTQDAIAQQLRLF